MKDKQLSPCTGTSFCNWRICFWSRNFLLLCYFKVRHRVNKIHETWQLIGWHLAPTSCLGVPGRKSWTWGQLLWACSWFSSASQSKFRQNTLKLAT